MATVAKPATASTETDAEERRPLQQTSAPDEIKRFEALNHEHNTSAATAEYMACLDLVHKAMGIEFLSRLESAAGAVLDGAVQRVLDRLVIGQVDEEGVHVWDLRLDR